MPTLSPAGLRAQHSHRLRSDAAAPRELVVVPLLDESALEEPVNEGARRRLNGIAGLVLRDLTAAVEREARALAPRLPRPHAQVRFCWRGLSRA